MADSIGIRREDKSEYERRTPVIPDHVRNLRDAGISVTVQSSDIRVFREKEYEAAGAVISEDLSACKVIFGIKEIPLSLFHKGGVYVFFSHVIKGQEYNMPMLKRMMELGCTLIDYERVVDGKNRRLIFFGKQAGIAGMVETLVAFGQRLEIEGIGNPFASIRRPLAYGSLAEIRAALEILGHWIRAGGLPEEITPVTVGITGYGNVSIGAQEMLDILPVTEVAPQELAGITKESPGAGRTVFKTIFREEDIVVPASPGAEFALQDYYDNPDRYVGRFEDYLPHLSILVNCILWTEAYPRLVTKRYLREHWKELRLTVIGDISCDVEGSVEATVKATMPGEPNYVYEPATGTVRDGLEGDGPVIMAVTILPSEIPRDSSIYFSDVLKEFIPAIARADYTVPFEKFTLPDPIKRAVILYHGDLTPEYRYIEKFLE
jgi:saccharopine dehydrogenase (NAD+, L-lysine-forming)